MPLPDQLLTSFITFLLKIFTCYYHCVLHSNLFTFWENARGTTMFPTIIQHLCSHHSTQAPLAPQHHWSVLFPDHSICCLFLTSFLSFAYSCLISASYLSSSSSTFSLRTSSSILGPTNLTPLPCYVEFRVSTSNLGS